MPTEDYDHSPWGCPDLLRDKNHQRPICSSTAPKTRRMPKASSPVNIHRTFSFPFEPALGDNDNRISTPRSLLRFRTQVTIVLLMQVLVIVQWRSSSCEHSLIERTSSTFPVNQFDNNQSKSTWQQGKSTSEIKTYSWRLLFKVQGGYTAQGEGARPSVALRSVCSFLQRQLLPCDTGTMNYFNLLNSFNSFRPAYVPHRAGYNLLSCKRPDHNQSQNNESLLQRRIRTQSLTGLLEQILELRKEVSSYLVR